jgi:hypothetical protein
MGRVCSNDSSRPRARYMFTGFPASREKTDRKNKKVKSSRYSFTGITLSSARISALGFHPNDHIAVEFEREQVFDQNDQVGCFPVPNGMSGGAVWRGEGDFKLWFTELPARLVGVGIECRRNQNALIAVRIHLVLTAMAKFYPSVAKFIPKRSGFVSDCTIVPWREISKFH